MITLVRDIYEILVGLKNEGIMILLVDQNICQAIRNTDYVYVQELGRNRHKEPREEIDDLKKALWL